MPDLRMKSREGEKRLRRSLIQIIGLPETFGVVLLTLALVLSLSPYLSGEDFGIFKIPRFPVATLSVVKVLGPFALGIILFLFLPIWKAAGDPAAPTARGVAEQTGVRSVAGGLRVQITTPESAPDLISRVLSPRAKFHLFRKDNWSQELRNMLGTVLAEIALNAFEHGQATLVDIGVYDYSIVVQDDGVDFNPLKFKPKKRTAGGAGLFALNYLLENAHPPIAASYRNFGNPNVGYPGALSNELVFHLLPTSSPTIGFGAPFAILLRGRTDRNDLVDQKLSHLVAIRWGFRSYSLDLDAIYRQTFQTYVISREADFLDLVIDRLPADGVLHLRVGQDAMTRRYYSGVVTRYKGRLALE